MSRTLLPLAALLALLALPASAATLHANKDTFWTVVKGAHPGDTVLLAGGAYPAASFNGIVFAEPGVTIRPADTARPPVFASLSLQASQGFNISGVEIEYVGKSFGLLVAGGGRIHADGLNIHSIPGTYNGNGVIFRGATDVSITNSEVHDLGTGISHIEDDGLRISGNIVHTIESDGIRGGGSSNLEISRNLLYDFSSQPGEHPDAIQFWGTKAFPRAGPIRITDNVVVRSPGAPPQSQGIFGAGAHDLTISGNLLLGTMFNGIAIADIQAATIEHNYVQGFKDMWSGITVRVSENVQIKDNATNAVNVIAGTKGVTQSGNDSLPQNNAVEARAFARWSSGRLR